MGRIYFENETTHERIALQPLEWENPPYQYMNQFSITVDGNIYYYYRGVMSNSGVLPALSQDIWSNAMTAGSAWWKSKRMRFPVSISVNPTFSQVGITGAKFDNQDFNVNISATSYYSEGQRVPCAILPYYTTYGGNEGILLIGRYNSDTYDVSYSECCFIPMSLWNFADEVSPYSPDGDTAAGDPDEKGGYANGFPNGNPAATSETKGIVFPFGSGVHCYVITPAQLNEFSRYMWGSAAGVFDEGGLWGKFQNYKFNPIAGILSCHSLPLVLMPTGSGSASISIAGTTLATATGSPCGTQFTSWTSQTVQIPEPWGSFVDYAYATISIYLPFCGIVPIDVSAVIGGSIYVRYYCDIINGNVAAWVIGTDRNGVSQLLKTATGNAAYHIPITGNDNGQGEIIGSIKQAVSSGISGNVGGLITAGVNIISGAEQHHTESVGSMNGNAGYCASTEVFLICNWPFPIYTGNYDSVRGRPSEVSGTVGSFSGYNEFEVHADSISGATEEEKQEIESLLQSGVFV